MMLRFLPPALANSSSVIGFKKLLTGNGVAGNAIAFLDSTTTTLARTSPGKIVVCFPFAILTGNDRSR